MTPAYIRPTQEGLYQHYSQIAHAAAIPIILYNVPGRTACDLLPETVARLSSISNIIGIKEATGQIARLEQLLGDCHGQIDVYSGDDLTAAQWMLAGAKGVISVTANVAPTLMAKMSDAALDNDKAACLQLHEQLMPLHQLMFIESNPIPVKWAVSRMGLMSSEIRMPMTLLAKEHHEAIEHSMRVLNLV